MNSQTKLRPERTLFYDVDTQRDFMLAGGALHVPGSETILPALRQLTELARRRNIRRLCSVDRHFESDRELSRNGGPWPDHCMDGTPGQQKVSEAALLNPCAIPSHRIDDRLLDEVVQSGRELLIEKQDVNVVAGNANSLSLLARLTSKYDQVVVYGVYTDVCVDYAVQALLDQGAAPYVVVDAIHDIDPDKAAAARQRWSRRGVKTVTLQQLKDLLDC
jgi:nicotinamidase/pyrazinamidase